MNHWHASVFVRKYSLTFLSTLIALQGFWSYSNLISFFDISAFLHRTPHYVMSFNVECLFEVFEVDENSLVNFCVQCSFQSIYLIMNSWSTPSQSKRMKDAVLNQYRFLLDKIRNAMRPELRSCCVLGQSRFLLISLLSHLKTYQSISSPALSYAFSVVLYRRSATCNCIYKSLLSRISTDLRCAFCPSLRSVLVSDLLDICCLSIFACLWGEIVSGFFDSKLFAFQD